MNLDIILETTWSEKAEGIVQHKHVLHLEPNGCVTYNRFQNDGTGWETTCFHDNLEKGIRFFLKKIAYDRKTFKESRKIRIILP